ncbi:MAG: AAA family ATPase [Actinomycetota bacterium]|nr:AAA family ATPase [Actinomycetota bacterium]
MTVCDRCGEDNPQRARFCLACGAGLTGVAPASESRKVITVLFADMVDSTGLGERLDPETMRNVMTLYFEVIRATIERHGGTVEKFIGDAVMAVFGIPMVHEDDALRAVKAAVDIQRGISDLSDELEARLGGPLQIRIGLNTGEVIAGSSLDDATGVVGDPINSAARLEKLARPGGIVMGADTHRLVHRSTTATPLGQVELTGKTEALSAFAVEGISDPDQASGLDVPLVGRRRELEVLERTFERVAEDQNCSLFTLLGAAGVGKSRLVREFVRQIEGRARVLRGRCLPYGDGITFWPVMETVFEAAAISDRDSQEDALGKILDLVGEHEDAKTIANLVGEALGLGQRTAGQEEIFWAVRLLFERLATKDPLVIVFDDIHWAEETFLDLLDHLVEWTTEAPLFVLCLARQELLDNRPTWGGGKMNSTTMLIDALRQEDARDLFAHVLGGDVTAISDQLHPVLEASGGNPLFLEETIAMLVEDGALQEVDGRWSASRDIAGISIPPTIHGLLAARLEQLSAAERSAVESAAVTGKVFSAQSVAHLLDDNDGSRALLQSLERKSVVRRDVSSDFAGEEMYRFRHILIRDAAYNGIPKERRAGMHERYADWLIEVMGERVAEYEEVIGYHFEQAHLYQEELGSEPTETRQRAAEHLGTAGRRALMRGDLPAATSLLSRAAQLAGTDAAGLRISIDLGDVLRESGEYDAACNVLTDAEKRAEERGDVTGRYLARLELEDTKLHAEPGRSTSALIGLIHDAIEAFEGSDDDLGLAYAYRSLGFVHDTVGRSSESLEALRRAVHHAEAAGDPHRTRVYQRVLMGSISWSPIDLESLKQETEKFLADARANSDFRSEARALAVLGKTHALRGNIEVGRRFIAQAKGIYDKLGMVVNKAWSAFESSAVEQAADDLEGMERELREAKEVLEDKEESVVLPTILALLADVVLSRGDRSEPRALIERAELMAPPDDVLTHIKSKSVRAKLLVQEDPGAALGVAKEAVSIAAATEYLDWHAYALVDLALVAKAIGDPALATEALRDALKMFDRKGMTVASNQVVKELELLGS